MYVAHSYVVYETVSTRVVATARTRAAAKAKLTRFIKSGEAEKRGYGSNTVFAIAETNFFREKIEKMVERVNMMSGVKYMERVNTPIYLSPSSETYWSM